MSRPTQAQAEGRWPHAHGFNDDETTRRLLRSRPPAQALRWVERQLGGAVISTQTLRGGMSSAVHLVTLELVDGSRRQAVLRRMVRPQLNIEEPDRAAREARSLLFVGGIDIPSPRLLAVDPTGDDAGVPTVLMTRLPGRVDWWPRDPERWLRRMAEVLPRLHGSPRPPQGTIPTYAPYSQGSYDPPPWARHRAAWERAVEIAAGFSPELPLVFVHRDFHPGNVLWWRGVVSGVVDWQAASIGPSVVDVGHCRTNLLTIGRRAADRFTSLWEQASATDYHPWADIVAIVGFLDDLRQGPGSDHRYLLEEVLVEAVAEFTTIA